MLFSLLGLVSLFVTTVQAVNHPVNSAPVNSKASATTKALYNLLRTNYGNHILSGQQDPNSYSWVEQNVGKSPAMLGLDMMDYSPSRVAFGSKGTATDDAIKFDSRGGIVTMVWHWNAPTGLINSAAEPWYSGFYTAATTFNLAAALADKNGANYQLILRDIDAIATQLKRLQSSGVSVIWRPLHEAEGGWFWWGRDKNPAPAKELYRIMFDRMTNMHGLNNLIWVWNSVASSWYPGDDVVDIVSCDSYPSAGDHGAVSGTFNQLKSLVGDKKIVAMTECGVIPSISNMQSSAADWSFFMTWNGNFISGGSSNSLDFLKQTFTSSYTLNLNNIQGWKSGVPSNPGGGGGGTTPTTPTSTASNPGATQVKYGQCGGTGYTGPTKCASGSTCTAVSPPYYYQCL